MLFGTEIGVVPSPKGAIVNSQVRKHLICGQQTKSQPQRGENAVAYEHFCRPVGAYAVTVCLVDGVQTPSGSLVVSAGSSSSVMGGNKHGGALNVKGSCKRFSERAGRNVSERRAGPENGHRRSRPSAPEGKAAVVPDRGTT